MNVWTITAVGITMVFAILVVLSEVLVWAGKWLGPKPKKPEPETSDSEGSMAIQDAAAIIGIMRTLGHEGNINIKRID